jgi:hypothetical protein
MYSIHIGRLFLDTFPHRSVSIRVAITGLLSFVLMGAGAALYGPTLPYFTESFELQSGTAGLVLSTHGAGAILGVLSALVIAGRSIARWRPAISMAALGLGTLLVGTAPTWLLTLVGVLFIGIGYGALTVGVNSLFAVGFGRRSPAMVNLLNGVFGIGSISGPLIILLNPDNPRFPFLILASVSVLLLPLGLMMDDRVPTVPTGNKKNQHYALLAAFVLLLALGAGLEASTAGYAATYLVATGVTASGAATITALFFVAFTVSRLVATPLSLRFKPAELTLGGLGLAAILLLASHYDKLAPISIILSGAAIALIFPNCFNWLSSVFSTSSGAVLVLAGALAGGMVIPAVIAQVVASLGELSIMSTLLGLTVITILIGFVVHHYSSEIDG